MQRLGERSELQGRLGRPLALGQTAERTENCCQSAAVAQRLHELERFFQSGARLGQLGPLEPQARQAAQSQTNAANVASLAAQGQAGVELDAGSRQVAPLDIEPAQLS